MKVGFLEESEGVRSSTRLVFVVGVFSVLLLAGYMVYTRSGNPVQIGTFVGTSIAALGGTKYFGTKNENSDTKDHP
jgi:hypothetical protein